MFKYVNMTCRSHVHEVFDEMFVMVRPGWVKSFINFYVRFFSFRYFSLWKVSLSSRKFSMDYP